MQFNIQQADRRLSANNYRALWSAQDRLNRLGILKTTFDVNKHIEPKHILKVMKDSPELFADLPPIPADALVSTEWVAGHLNDPDVRIVESNEDPLLYTSGHLPGAVYVSLEDELSDHTVTGRGRHPLPSGRDLEAAARRWGRRQRKARSACRSTSGPWIRRGATCCSPMYPTIPHMVGPGAS